MSDSTNTNNPTNANAANPANAKPVNPVNPVNAKPAARPNPVNPAARPNPSYPAIRTNPTNTAVRTNPANAAGQINPVGAAAQPAPVKPGSEVTLTNAAAPATATQGANTTHAANTPNPIEALLEQRIEEQAGVPLSQMTGEQAVAAMLAASAAPSQSAVRAGQLEAAPAKTAAELLAEYLAPHMEGVSPEASRTFVIGKTAALMRLLYPAKTIGVQDVVTALLH
jgi:hypothetical protein